VIAESESCKGYTEGMLEIGLNEKAKKDTPHAGFE
jgi:hypothetical protein